MPWMRAVEARLDLPIGGLNLALSFALLSAASGCVGSKTRECSFGVVCPAGQLCDDSNTLCIYPSQREACAGEQEDAPCSFPESPGTPHVCRRGTCLPLSSCGNALLEVEEGEVCDCGHDPADLPPGCSGPNSDTAPDACREDCRPAHCGDGVVDAGEECDDGNLAPGDGCNGVCALERCGNGVLDAGEVCDDGNTEPGDGCRGDCRSDETCGNGEVDPATGETCDDGNAASHDGCSSGCTVESLQWRRLAANALPRTDAALAFDTQRGRLVLFGGRGRSGVLGDTWEHDGSAWILLTPSVSPPARYSPAIAYDEAAGRVVLFGGWNGVSRFGDTWVYDGVTWVELTTGPGPTARDSATLVFDDARQRLVLFGGFENGGALDDTWELVNGAWVERSLSPRPEARSGHRAAYDSLRQRTTIHGGSSSSNTILGAPWAFDGTSWAPIVTTKMPPNRTNASFTYDPVRDRHVLHGGWSEVGQDAGTFEYDGTNWRELLWPVQPMLPRSEHSAAYDPIRGGVVVFGGYDGAGPLGDLHLFDGVDWRVLESGLVPAPRHSASMAYDSAQRRLVLFGGILAPLSTASQTWALAGEQWDTVTTSTVPPEGNGFAMVWDAGRQRLVLAGTSIGDDTFQTWELDVSEWRRVNTLHAPAARTEHGVAYDATRERVVLFGGMRTGRASTLLEDTWEYDGTDWREVTPSLSPGARGGPALAFDPSLDAVLLHGGYTDARPIAASNETWVFDGASWRQVLTGTAPRLGYDARLVLHEANGRLLLMGRFAENVGATAIQVFAFRGIDWDLVTPATEGPGSRENFAVAYDPSRRAVLVFGGSDAVSNYHDDAWWLEFGSAWPDEQCDNGVDDDSDGLVDCLDPDCRCP